MTRLTTRFRIACAILLLTLTVGLAPAPGAACTGDCDDDGSVTVAELITGVNIALGAQTVDACEPFDASSDGSVTVNELVAAVSNALCGCGQACATPVPSTPTTTRIPTPESTPTPTNTPTLSPAGNLTGTWDVTVSLLRDDCEEGLGEPETSRVTIIQDGEGRIQVVEVPFIQGIVEGYSLRLKYDLEEDGGVTYYDGSLTIAPDFRSFSGQLPWEWVADPYSCGGIEQFDGVRVR